MVVASGAPVTGGVVVGVFIGGFVVADGAADATGLVTGPVVEVVVVATGGLVVDVVDASWLFIASVLGDCVVNVDDVVGGIVDEVAAATVVVVEAASLSAPLQLAIMRVLPTRTGTRRIRDRWNRDIMPESTYRVGRT
jgi:hypothetical protein